MRRIGGAFHLLGNSENSSWDVNGTHVFRALHWKVPGNNWNFKKVVLFSRWKISGEKACSIYEFSQGIIGSYTFVTRWTFLWKFPKVFGKWKMPMDTR